MSARRSARLSDTQPEKLASRIRKLSLTETRSVLIIRLLTPDVPKAKRVVKRLGLEWKHDFAMGVDVSFAHVVGPTLACERLIASKNKMFITVTRDVIPELC